MGILTGMLRGFGIGDKKNIKGMVPGMPAGAPGISGMPSLPTLPTPPAGSGMFGINPLPTPGTAGIRQFDMNSGINGVRG
jgi:hypothetical protein